MARSYDIAVLSQKVEQMEGRIKANDVVANPSGAASTLLKKIGIDGTNYNVPHTATQIDYDSSTSVKAKIDEINGSTRISGNSEYFDGSSLPYMYYKQIGNVVVGGSRFTITTEKPSGQANFLFEGLPVPVGSIVPVIVSVGDTTNMIINNQGHLTANEAISGTHNVSFCYICE